MFGFQITRRRRYPTNELMGWQVFLPHSCDEWEIADEEDNRHDAIAALRAFIAEARSTLEFLEQTSADWEGHYGPNWTMRFDANDVTYR